MPSISLYCTEGSANKEYHIELLPKEAGFVVNVRRGPRGKSLISETKTPNPIDLATATKIYDKLLREKTGKGYTPDVSGVAYTSTAMAGLVSGWRPALLTPVDEVGVQALLDSNDWVGSQKMDGERRGAEISVDGIRGMNRRGLYVDIPSTWTPTLAKLPIGTIVDGEQIGDVLYIFDCPQLGARDLRTTGYEQRHALIRTAIWDIHGKNYADPVTVISASTDPAEKREMLRRIEQAHGEGIVLRRAGGHYEAGLAEGNVKFKLYEESTCIVAKVNTGVRSVALSMLDDSRGNLVVPVGNVTIPPNHTVPAVGELVEIRYMHMFSMGSLYQPVYKGKRTDLEFTAAKLSQVTRIKLKDSNTSDADEADEVPVVATAPETAPAARRMRM